MGLTNIFRAAAAALIAQQALAAVDPITAKVSQDTEYHGLVSLISSGWQH